MPASSLNKTKPSEDRSSKSPEGDPGARLAHLPARVKLERLLKSAKGKKKALILTHDNPDPDSLASAVALAHLLRAARGHRGPGGLRRHHRPRGEHRLREGAAAAGAAALAGGSSTSTICSRWWTPSRRWATTRCRRAPRGRGDRSPPAAGRERCATPFADVGGDFGATSTMLVEYLRAARLEPSVEVATALFYGIKADTRDLGRETTSTDIDSYLWLFPQVDKRLLEPDRAPGAAGALLPAVPHGLRAGEGVRDRRRSPTWARSTRRTWWPRSPSG